MSKEYLDALKRMEYFVNEEMGIKTFEQSGWHIEGTDDYELVEQALLRLDKYEQILSSGRLTDRNYRNTTLDIDSCKPYLRLGQLEDIYEEGKQK